MTEAPRGQRGAPDTTAGEDVVSDSVPRDVGNYRDRLRELIAEIETGRAEAGGR